MIRKRIIFGSTQLSVSPVCFGTWQLSPRFWGEVSKHELLTAMNFAYDVGINFFDTADAYGDGLAETVLGEFLSAKPRENIIVCTKVFNHFRPDSSRYPDLSSAYVKERCDIQLKRLRTDYIDIYLLHFWDPLTSPAEISATMEELKKAGKIRFYGVSNHTVEQLRAQRKYGDYQVCQPSYSLISNKIEEDLLPYCQSENIGVMIYSPMHKGLLTGKYSGDEKFADFRLHHPDFQGERFKLIAEAVRSLKPLADKNNMSIYQLVLSATLLHPAINVAIVGIKTRDQIKEAVGVIGREISREDYFEVRKILALDSIQKIKDASGNKK